MAFPATVRAEPVPVIAATVKVLSPTARLVHIVNRDTVAGHLFLIRATDSPRIVGGRSPAGACTLSFTSFFIIAQKHTEYRAKCRVTLAPGHSVDIRVETRGAGRLGVVACPAKAVAGPCAF